MLAPRQSIESLRHSFATVAVRWTSLHWLVFCALGAGPALGAQRVTVIARDSATAAYLPDVLISLLDTTAGVVTAMRTDHSGRAELAVPAPGSYAVRALRIGWRPIVSGWITIAGSDSLEITVRMPRIVVNLSPVVIRAQRDSISHLVPPGINVKSLTGRLVVPAEVAAHAPGSRDYVDVIGSVGVAGLTVNTWRDAWQRERRCIGSSRSISRRECVAVYVDNVRTDPEAAMDLATPDRLHFAIWLRPGDAGVLYGTGTSDGVLLLFTNAYSRSLQPR